MMQIRTGQVKHLPYERHEVTQGHEEHEMRLKSSGVDRYTIAHTNELHTSNTPSLHSTCLRMAVVLHKLSNVKLDRRWSSLGSVQSLQCNAQRSLDLAAPADRYLSRSLGGAATPPGGYVT